jgi:sucrose-6-phosphate hydrolase SacC (GH32 family)
MNLANMVQYRADLSKYLGQNLYIEIEDEATSDWGLIFADAFFTYYVSPPTDGILATNLYDPSAGSNQLPETIQNPSFETGDLTGWTQTEGNAFTGTVTSDTYFSGDPSSTFGQVGKYHLWGLKGAPDADADARTGTLESSRFKLGGTGTISFLIGGGNDSENLYVALVRASDGAVLYKATGPGSEAYQRVTWDAKQYRGQELFIRIVDHATSGHINADDFQVLGQGLLDSWSFDEGKGKTTLDSAAGINDPVAYVFNDAKYKPSTDPQWRDGIKGKGLLFDGYSTYVTRKAADFVSPSNALTIEAWVAPRSYEWGDLKQLSAIVNQQDTSSGKGFILGMGRHGTWALQASINGSWQEVWAADDKPLVKNQWSYIAATIDNEAGKMSLYLNGQLVGEKDIPQNGNIDAASNADLIIGKHNNPAIINGVFSANMFDGMMDEVKIYNKAESANDITANYQQYTSGFNNGVTPTPDLSFDRGVFDGDQYRPQYHFIAPEHWMNEPHGPLYFDGKYHIFYQFDPQGPYWHQIHWGHAVSDDMVHWKDMPIAISPDGGSVTPDGVWSGSTVVGDNGDPMAFFTAGDDSKTPNQMVGLARSTFLQDGDNNLKKWVLDPAPVNVQQQNLPAPEGVVWYGQFRDPFVWKDGDTWYQLVASGIKDTSGNSVGGTALLYTSTDMVHWDYKGPFYVGNYAKYPKSGQVWELPVFLPLGTDSHGAKKWIMLVSPWFDHYTNDAVKHVYYWIGTWDKANNKFIPDKEEPTEFDYGEHFTGPSGMVDPKGRTIVYSIAQDERTEQEHYDAGWAHNAGLPLVLSLKDDDTLGIAPIEELNSLRNQQLASISNQSVAQANEQLKNVKGDMLEIKMEVDVKDATKFGIHVRQSNYGIEETPIYYDVQNQSFNIDRNKSSLNPDTRKGIQGGAMSLDGKTLQLHIYLDRSMIEAYANGKNSITSRVYPTRFDSLGLSLFASGGKPIVKSMEVWSMNSAYGNTVPVTGTNKHQIPHGELPNHDFQNGDVSGWIVDGEAFSPEHVTTATDWGWGGPFLQAQTPSDPNGYHLWGFNPNRGGDDATGTLTSQNFVLGGDGQIDFLVGGGNNPDKLYFALVRASDHQILMKATGSNSEQYRRVHWDASQYIGETLYVQLVDNATGGFGHINLDDVNVPVAIEPLYHLNGDVELNGDGKSAVTVNISNSQGVVYSAKYNTVSADTYGVGDKVDDQGQAVSGYVHYFFNVPAGTYTITATAGKSTRSTTVTTDSNDDVYQNMYQQQVAELSLKRR